MVSYVHKVAEWNVARLGLGGNGSSGTSRMRELGPWNGSGGRRRLLTSHRVEVALVAIVKRLSLK